MTNYNAWDAKTAALCKEADEEDEREKKAANEALGLTDGPQGPPVAKAKEQRKEMGEHSDHRKNFFANLEADVMTLENPAATEELIKVSDANGKALRLRSCSNVSYEIAEEQVITKLFITNCTGVKVRVRCIVKTSFLEIDRCSDLEVILDHPVATIQCDELTKGPVRVFFQEPENLGNIYHQNCPSLEVAIVGQEPRRLGTGGQKQLFSAPTAEGAYRTEEVIRGEKEFPVNALETAGVARRGGLQQQQEPESEQQPADERRREEAEAQRLEGNSAFKASDFLQAAVYYTKAIDLCGDMHVVWANRAQCWLKTGQPEKALDDAVRCTELAPDFAKGWFRKGMALHALQRYGQAIPALVEAERLDPKNQQIPEAIKMAQMMCRKHGPGESR